MKKKIMKEILEKIIILYVIAWPITMIFLASNLAFAVTMVKIEIIVGGICMVGLVITDLLDINEK